ncbi:ABC transporter permease [Sphingobium sp. H39-3-25]|uniref:ABC transporter permease n=1 Tax=Sphingobium arseniciresistens TaxID=3030834 RepID=UPI0023B9468A|nr:ABC transporter permease [Sphingobium arseniciresistens]
MSIGKGTGSNIRAGKDIDPRAWLILPAVILVLITFTLPVGGFLLRGFSDPALGFGNFIELLKEPVYGKIIWNTVAISASVTLLSLLISFPLSYSLVEASPAVRKVLVVIIMIPLWTSILVQGYAWVVLLQDNGVINRSLMKLGILTEPFPLIYNRTGVLIAMTQAQLPLMVLPLYGVMSRLDNNLTRAASVLGAGPVTTFLRVYLPQTVPGILSGCSLVFALCLGYYITPALVGGHSDTMISQLIVVEIEELGEWGMASALSLVLLFGMILIFCAMNLINRRALRGAKK